MNLGEDDRGTWVRDEDGKIEAGEVSEQAGPEKQRRCRKFLHAVDITFMPSVCVMCENIRTRTTSLQTQAAFCTTTQSALQARGRHAEPRTSGIKRDMS